MSYEFANFDTILLSLKKCQNTSNFGILTQISTSELMAIGDTARAAQVLGLWVLNEPISVPEMLCIENLK